MVLGGGSPHLGELGLHARSVRPVLVDEGSSLVTDRDGGVQQHRSQEMNRDEALARLQELVDRASVVPKTRRPTKPSRSAKKKRLEGQIRRGRIKQLRGQVRED